MCAEDNGGGAVASSYALYTMRGGQRKVIYDPLPHQIKLHTSQAKYCLMQGSRGGGKSKCLRMDAYMRCLSIPRFRALLVRRSMPELRDSHLTWVPFEADQLGLPKDAWHSTNYILRFPNHSMFRFSHIEDDAALVKLLSSEWEWIGVDELATFTYRQFAFLATSLRTPIPELTPVLRAATNPVGIGAQWVKEFFIDKSPDPDEFPDYDPSEYEDIPCQMDDNPHVDPKSYSRVFANLPSKALRDALRFGKWVIEGQFFTEWAAEKDGKPWHVINEMPRHNGRSILDVPGIEVFRSIDWGYAAEGNPGVCLWFAAMPDGSLVVFDEYVFRETLPEDVAQEIKRRSIGMKVRYTVADPSMFGEHEGPSLAEHFANAGVSLIEGDRDRPAGWITVHKWLRDVIDDGISKRPKLRVLRDACPLTIRSMPAMVIDERNPNDMKTRGVPDDCPDALRYACMSRPSASRLPVQQEMSWVRRQLLKERRGRRVLGAEATRSY